MNQNSPIRIYDCNTTDAEVFARNGLAVLVDAKDVTEILEINGERRLEFTLPLGPKWKHVHEEAILRLGDQRYRIKTIDGKKITAQAVYMDSSYKHIQYMPNMVNTLPRDIMTAIFAGTPVEIMSEKDITDLGMEWVDHRTDFFECSKLTPIGALHNLMEQLDKYKAHNELYVDNYKIALVKQIGSDRNVRIDMAYNAKTITPKRDTTMLVTRLYPYGKDDLHVDSVTPGEVQYVDSPNYGTGKGQWKREGCLIFDEIDDPNELKKAAQEQFDPNNPERIDIPKYSVTVDYIERKIGEIQLGDIVTVIDRDFGVTSKQRVVKMERHPFEPNKNKATLGTPPKSVSEIFGGLLQDNIIYDRHTNEKGELKTGWLECMQENKSIEINQQLGKQDIALYKTGALFEAPDGSCAIALIQGQLAIAGSKTNGKWNWTTIMNDNEVIVSKVFTGELFTNLVTILSANGRLKIENSLITMLDNNGKTRFEAGYSGGNYKFILRNADGKQTAYLDDNGNLTVTGIFKTGDTGARTVIDGNGIQSWDGNGRKAGLWSNDITNGNNRFCDLTLYYNGNEFFQARNELGSVVLKSNGISFLNARENIVTGYGAWEFDNCPSDSFVSADGKTVTVKKGLITEIK